MTYNWLEHWEQGDIPFHLDAANPFLEKYWSKLKVTRKANVLVPLCGKSKDLLWLMNQGYHVIGIELSEIACEAFFVENNLSFKKIKNSKFLCYHHDQIKLYCGDFFALSSDMIPTITAVYDRAALQALPKKLRQIYACHLAQLIVSNGQMLLITYDSPTDLEQGPPYSVSFQEVKGLFETKFQINELVREQKIEISKPLWDKGYRELYKVAYNLKKI
ncbi:MAG TPA: thiopurine S-methyltransferase [Aquella sp.]|nr:thiopurine S-methyltransferase [Aquella sp.]